MKRKEYLVKLTKLISIAMGMDFGEVKERIGVARVEVDNVYYRVHLDGKEHWGYGNGEQGEDDDE